VQLYLSLILPRCLSRFHMDDALSFARLSPLSKTTFYFPTVAIPVTFRDCAHCNIILCITIWPAQTYATCQCVNTLCCTLTALRSSSACQAAVPSPVTVAISCPTLCTPKSAEQARPVGRLGAALCGVCLCHREDTLASISLLASGTLCSATFVSLSHPAKERA
jgi:hypothetical protein